MATIGRGRGRGRGGVLKALQDEKPGQNASASPVSGAHSQASGAGSPVAVATTKLEATAIGQHEDATAKLDVIITSMESMTESEMLSKIPSEIQKIKSADNMKEFVNLLCKKSLKEPDFAVSAARLCNELWNDNELKSLVKAPLLAAVQNNYKKRDKFKKKKTEKFFGLCVLLCELYKVLRIKDRPLCPLTSPVCQMLKELIEQPTQISSEDVFYFYQELESVGQIIQNEDQNKMDDIINTARQIAISSQNLSPAVRCRLIQLIELHAANWKMSDELIVMYEDLQQDLLCQES
ncbi:MIF4G domain-containing protein A-like [Hydractinia symbiolongicarpus]|uniref:MIF4G domain-containing protein A-like n=1 Tax=Hydractinia symbiolongicarpus TaxID=13093 RepID=UPI0025506206|nr:MIF4G domain-containing protein A-like [Hydractinia symbiolongicarpus]XP_057295470.1 MIF4G domain-containing protein A-like [Hydractinia symbiolongicarpus]